MHFCEAYYAPLPQLQPDHHRRTNILPLLRKNIRCQALSAHAREPKERCVLLGVRFAGVHNSTAESVILAQADCPAIEHLAEICADSSFNCHRRVCCAPTSHRSESVGQCHSPDVHHGFGMVPLEQASLFSPQTSSEAFHVRNEARGQKTLICSCVHPQFQVNAEQAYQQMSGRSPPPPIRSL